MSASKLEFRHRAPRDSSVVPLEARRGWCSQVEEALPRDLQKHLLRVITPPIDADVVVIVLASSSGVWTAFVWPLDDEPRAQSVPPPPDSAWLSTVVRRGERVLLRAADSTGAGLPWLADAQACLAVPLADDRGKRLGAIVVAARRERDWGQAAERRLLEIVHDASVHIERLWLQLDLAETRAKLQAARDEAAEARDRRDTMLAVLGHELRNPLAPLTTALELLWERAPAGLHAELSVMDRQLRQLGRLVDDLFDLSRVFGGDLELDRRPVRLRDVVLTAAENVKALIAAREHALIADVSPELSLEADEARLTQIVTALLTNSARHTPRGRRIHVSAHAQEQTIEIVVEDDGGIAPDVLETAFDPFNGAHTEGRGAGGLGLGLPIARAVAERHGGEIELRSEGQGLGTTAIVRLPRQHAAAVATPKRPSSRSALALPHRVLVVDDNRDAADMLADAIRSWGGTAVVAYESASALVHAQQARFDVALVDIAMPEMNGLELARELRRLPSGRELRIIAVSGFGEPADAERSRDAGMDAHLVKPVSLRDILRVLTEISPA